MEPITPREFDPSRIRPDDDAEPIAALSFLLELPHCLRINDVVFSSATGAGVGPGGIPTRSATKPGCQHPFPRTT